MTDTHTIVEGLIDDGLPPKAAARIAHLFAEYSDALVTKEHFDLRLDHFESKFDVRFIKIESQLKYVAAIGLLILGGVGTGLGGIAALIFKIFFP